jgi:hypothetical protein
MHPLPASGEQLGYPAPHSVMQAMCSRSRTSQVWKNIPCCALLRAQVILEEIYAIVTKNLSDKSGFDKPAVSAFCHLMLVPRFALVDQLYFISCI